MKRIVALVLALCLLPLMPAGAAAQNDDAYRLKPGDVVRVEVLEDNSLNRDALILPDGRITLPLAGSVVAGGRSLEQLQGDVTARLRPSFAAAPTVFVSLSRLAEPAPRRGVAAAVITVHVVGEAAKPGPMQLRPGTTLLQAFSAMGGFSRFAATKRVQLRRIGPDGQEQVYVFDYDAMERGAVRGGMTILADGDVIVVPQRRLFE